MKKFEASVEPLREILENIHDPAWLEAHPWTESLFVQEFVAHNPELSSRSPGEQLVLALKGLFHRMMPAVPPHQGKRLDARWGEFGLLAAMYFAPLEFNTPQPASLREAWGRIDQAILAYVSVDAGGAALESELERYKLVSAEPETGPASTISDWHRRGLQRLAEIIAREEQRLGLLEGQPAASGKRGNWRGPLWRWLRWALLLAILGVLSLVGMRAWGVVQRLQDVQQHVQALRSLSLSNLNAEQVDAAGEHLSALRLEISALEDEAAPFLSLAPYLGWLPSYGGDLTQAPALMEMALQLSILGDETLQAVSPLVPAVLEDRNSVSIPELLEILNEADTQLLTAQIALAQARAARQQVETERLSEDVRNLLVEEVDPFLLAAQGAFPVDDVLQMARIAPRLLGAVENGPQTYLILVQNEDELRPTGGFLTAVGRLTVQDGSLTQVSFEGVSLLDDFNKPYPSAPWQLDEYMRSELFVLRDANWFTDFPTSVDWVEFLYAYTRPGEIDGVITVDQHVVVQVLREIGPLAVEGQEQLISADNVMGYMRQERNSRTPAGFQGEVWDRKQFINRLGEAMLQKMLARQGYSLNGLLRSLMRLLDEKHILLQFDDPEMKELLAKRGWDGAVRPSANSDFLMAVDANVGFNKTNLVVEQSLAYQVDLQDLTDPLAHLNVHHSNRAQVELTCYQYPASVGIHIEQEYPFKDCYWNYLRVYTPAGSALVSATPHAIPAGRTLRETAVPARVDSLGDENLPGTAVYGTLLVVPPGESLNTGFDLRLPQTVLEQDRQASTWTYRLTVQKQPGTLAVPFYLQFLLPTGMQVLDSSHALQFQDGAWTLETDLRQDLVFYLTLGPEN